MRLSKRDGSMACLGRSGSTKGVNLPRRSSIYGPMPTGSLDDSREKVEEWRIKYNEVRSHSAIGDTLSLIHRPRQDPVAWDATSRSCLAIKMVQGSADFGLEASGTWAVCPHCNISDESSALAENRAAIDRARNKRLTNSRYSNHVHGAPVPRVAP
jgi:hypothetical protein